MRLLIRALVIGRLREGKLRSLVTVVAVALGVAISLAIDLANATAVASFSRSVNVVAGRVNLQVVGVGRGFDERTLLRVATVAGVVSASPAIEDDLVVGARRGDANSGEVLHALGVDVLRPLPRDASTGAAEGTHDLDLLVNRHGAIVSDRVARRYGLRAGGSLRAIAGDRAVTLPVASVIPPTVVGIDSSVVFLDVATAQDIFAKVGRLDRIDCVVEPARLAATKAQIERILPAGTRAIEPAVRTGEIARMLQSFQLNLAALSAIALVVGMYLIFNTVAFAVVQRRSEIGTARALGASRGAIFTVFLLEGALFGIAGSLAGLALGAALARFSVAAVARTVQTLYIGTGVDRVIWDPIVIAKAFAIGLVLSIVAAVVPSLEAARVEPALAMRSFGFERRLPHFGPRAAALGLLCLAVALG
ncbi:MAG: FtsX-like permease family protein, partial [Candidatus Eremiobacteraeota bacterium]|nr:FtsX-like permease family protein [Candidatus Eremiobacteraeota bacterium]